MRANASHLLVVILVLFGLVLLILVLVLVLVVLLLIVVVLLLLVIVILAVRRVRLHATDHLLDGQVGLLVEQAQLFLRARASRTRRQLAPGGDARAVAHTLTSP